MSCIFPSEFWHLLEILVCHGFSCGFFLFFIDLGIERYQLTFFIQSINGLVIDSLTRLSVSDINSSDSVGQDGS